MSSNLVIVAIPAADDPIWKISSEKIPHLTLLFLGEADNNSKIHQIYQFVAHAVNLSEHGPFYMDVDRRDILGEDKADVIHFRKDYSYKWLNQFRHQLLQNSDIRTAYDSTEQFPEWRPHLTLGYPETPAHEDKVPEHGFSMVRFDRIAVWTGDYEGPQFRLEWPDREEAMAVAYSETGQAAVEELLHFGTKGMKWGVRKVDNGGEIRINPKTNQASLSKPSQTALITSAVLMPPVIPALFLSKRFRSEVKAARAQNKLVQGDKEYKKAIEKSKKAVETHNTAADEINSKVTTFNANKRWKNKDGSDIDLTQNPVKQKEYDDAVAKELINPAYANAAIKVYGSDSPSGRYRFEINDTTNATLKFRDTLKEKQEARHADDNEEIEVQFTILRDGNGHILGFKPEELEKSMTQSALGEAYILKHFGTKGMKWGVRKEQYVTRQHQQRLASEAVAQATRPARDVKVYPTIGASKRKKAKVDTKGGEDHPPTADAIKVAEAKQKLKKSGAAALTNNELQVMQRRLNLENDVQRLMVGNKTSGKKFVDGLLGRGSKDERREFENQAGRQIQELATPTALKIVKKAVAR